MKNSSKVLILSIAVMMMVGLLNWSKAMNPQEKKDSAKKCVVDIPYTIKGVVSKIYDGMPWDQKLKNVCYMVWSSPSVNKSYITSAAQGAKKGEEVKFALIFKKKSLLSAKVCGVSASKEDLAAGVFVVTMKVTTDKCEGVFEMEFPDGKTQTFKYPVRIIE